MTNVVLAQVVVMGFLTKKAIKQPLGEQAVNAVNAVLNGGLLATYGLVGNEEIAGKVSALATELKNDELNNNNLELAIAEFPFYLRGHIERVLYQFYKKEKQTIPACLKAKVETPLCVSFEKPSSTQPFIYHMAGTSIKRTHPGDALAHVVRENQAYEIIGGTQGVAMGGGGRKKTRKILRELDAMGDNRPKKVALTGFSRGSTVQIGLAAAIHKRFNQGKDKQDWITIDMFLVDPAFGSVDMNGHAGTKQTQVPECVNTMNILYANDQTP